VHGELVAKAANAGESSTDFVFSSRSLTEQAVDELFEGQKIYRALEIAALQTKKKLVTSAVRYSVDYESRLVTVLFETKD